MTDDKTIRLSRVDFVDRITKPIQITNTSTELGVGDDAAIIVPSADLRMLVATDQMLEGIHFDLTYTPLRHLGYKAVVSVISDIYAMNAHPKQLTCTIGVSKRFGVQEVEELYAGILTACQYYGVDLVGGDTSSSLTGLCLSLTAVGEARAEHIVKRSGARPTDLICVTGNLGAAYMGLQLLEREKHVFDGMEGEFEPDFAGREYILERQLRPEAQRGLIAQLAEHGYVPTSMIDVSDGLASELLHIARASGVGVRVYEERLPIDFETARMAEEFNLNVTSVALSGGEDFEMLFTLPLGMADQIKALDGVHVIGHITEPSLGNCLVARDGTEIALTAQGWTPAS